MFLNLTMLAGIAGALLPLLLHLLSRSRYRTVEWGAMMFLQGRDGAVVHATRFKQALILLLRMGIVAGLAMALAQPVASGRWGALARDAKINAVIVLDASASMGYDEQGKSRQELARSAVLGILETLRENRVAIVLMGPRSPEGLDQLTADLQQLAQRVIALPEPSGRADLAWGLSRAAEILNRSSEPNRELYVVCDRQASSWREASSEGFRQTWRSRLDRPGTRTRFFVVPVGSKKSENLAIESVDLVNPPAIAGQDVEIEVKIHNYGAGYRAGVDLRVSAGQGDEKTVPVSIGPDATATVRLPWRFWGPASRLVTASLKGSGLKFDDQMQAAVDVIEPIRVLIISGDERGLPLRNESDFPRIALAPRTAEARLKGDWSDKPRGDPCRVEIKPVEKWNELNLHNFQVVILANIAQLTQAQSQDLEEFVFQGGGLWIAPGSLARPDNYNAMLWRDGAGIMPARLLPATEEDGSEATAIQGISDFDHPVFRFLKGRPDPIPPVTIARYFPVDVRARDAKVLAQYVSGRPFLVEGAWGRSRVMLITTPLDADWSTLPLSNFYLPMMQSVVRHLVPAGERNLLPGAPIVARFGPMYEMNKAELRLPPGEGHDNRPVPLSVSAGEVRYPGTQQPGIYELRVEGTMPPTAKHLYFIVQTPRVESDLTPLTETQWADLGGRLGFELLDPARRPVAAAIAAARGGRELWMTLIGVVIGLCMMETVLTRRWSGEGAP